ncbi:unnamed protein product [Lupinus luteus]|uniref:Uncharacterized protein n=1 Tax=Lupinus luteus TaxID=3873 RepID=A0AAV1YJD8_LUPLU
MFKTHQTEKRSASLKEKLASLGRPAWKEARATIQKLLLATELTLRQKSLLDDECDDTLMSCLHRVIELSFNHFNKVLKDRQSI